MRYPTPIVQWRGVGDVDLDGDPGLQLLIPAAEHHTQRLPVHLQQQGFGPAPQHRHLGLEYRALEDEAPAQSGLMINIPRAGGGQKCDRKTGGRHGGTAQQDQQSGAGGRGRRAQAHAGQDLALEWDGERPKTLFHSDDSSPFIRSTAACGCAPVSG